LLFNNSLHFQGLHLTRFYSKNINLTRPIQDDRSAEYYLPSNIEFLKRGKELCPHVKTSISDKDSQDVTLDDFQDFQDFFDEKSDAERQSPKLPIIVGAGKRPAISSYLLLFILAILGYFFNLWNK
uniref:Plasmodium vivax Vir protein n=1 Tax=Onchocerca flexuosa TaxID=387005 RepID=A0A183HHW3_9BILA